MKTVKWLAAAALGLAAARAGTAAQTPVDILIQRLVEKNILTPADAEGIRDDIARIEKEQAAAAAPVKKPAPAVTSKNPVKLSGFAQLRYLGSNEDGFHDRLEPRRVRLTISAQPAPKMDLKTQVEFAGSRKGQTGATTTALFGRPILLDAVAGLTVSPAGRIQLGQFKVPFGSESIASGTDLELINRSTVTETLAPGRDNASNGRDIGIQFGGSARAGARGGAVDYALGVFNGSGINTGDDNDGKDIAARAAWKPAVPGLTLGADFYDGRSGGNSATRDRQGVDLLFTREPWLVRAEHIWAKDGSVKKRGYYGTLAYSIVPRTQVAVRYDRLDPNTGAADDATGTLTFGLTRLLSADGLQRWQVNYERRREQGGQVRNDQYLAQFQLGF